jgi:hypothetical protein
MAKFVCWLVEQCGVGFINIIISLFSPSFLNYVGSVVKIQDSWTDISGAECRILSLNGMADGARAAYISQHHKRMARQIYNALYTEHRYNNRNEFEDE